MPGDHDLIARVEPGFAPIDLAQDPRDPARSPSAALIAAGVMWGLLFLVKQCLPEEPGEPLLLRWLRTATEHPLRMSLVGALLAQGLFCRSAVSKPRPARQGSGKNP